MFEVSSELLDEDNKELIMKANLIYFQENNSSTKLTKIRTKNSSVVTVPNADVIMISLDDQNSLDVAEFLALEAYLLSNNVQTAFVCSNYAIQCEYLYLICC